MDYIGLCNIAPKHRNINIGRKLTYMSIIGKNTPIIPN